MAQEHGAIDQLVAPSSNLARVAAIHSWCHQMRNLVIAYQTSPPTNKEVGTANEVGSEALAARMAQTMPTDSERAAKSIWALRRLLVA